MRRFIFRIFIFIIIGVATGELIVRVFPLSIDIPRFYRDTDNLIKFEPDQSGNSMVGQHKWIINKYGNYGYEPQSLDSVITVIGDSYISNTMNPPECHQANYLANLNPEYDFYPMSRDGASFIEFMEMAKSLEYLNPIRQLLYVHHGDFVESVMECGSQPLTVQLSVEQDSIRYAALTSSRMKEVMYNFKLGYYLYRNYLVRAENNQTNNRNVDFGHIDYDVIQMLLDFVKDNYRTDHIVLVFSPGSDTEFVEFAGRNGFQTLFLQTDDYKSWQLESDSHWSCFGHEEAAKQVDYFLHMNLLAIHKSGIEIE